MSIARSIRRRLIRGAVALVGAAAGGLLLFTMVTTGFDNLLGSIRETFEENHPSTAEPMAEVPAQLIRVVDGDTIAVVPSDQLPATNDAGTEHVVRILGIDAPEMNKMSADPAECGAQEATDHLVAMLGDGAQLSLTFDGVSDHSDRYGRSLAYVETLGGAQVVDAGAAMIRDGFAEAWYPHSEPAPERFDAYAALQFEAASAGVGSHATCATIGR